jgi:lipopolysaccharide export system protein LptA
MRSLLLAISISLLALAATAQSPDSDSINFEQLGLKADVLEGNFKTGQFIEFLEGNVRIDLIADDPAESIGINADKAEFSYDEQEGTGSGDAMPSAIEFTGNVVIEMQGRTISSPRAIISPKENSARFIGKTTIKVDGRDPYTMSEISINLKTGDIRGRDLKSGTK